jgi:hypothetical protein
MLNEITIFEVFAMFEYSKSDEVRIELFENGILRLEYSRKKVFTDSSTYLTLAKNSLEPLEANLSRDDDFIIFKNGIYDVFIPNKFKNLNKLKCVVSGIEIGLETPEKNTGELPLPENTPEIFILNDKPHIFLPSGGYSLQSVENGEHFKIDVNDGDFYLLFCAKDQHKLRRLYVELTGRSELVRLSTLGLRNSRYYPYSQKEAEAMIENYANHNLPLDNMVIDTDWRKSSDRGIGYEVNDKLFSDLSYFFSFAHSHGVEIMFNDHPEPVEGADDIFSKKEIIYREEKLTGILSMGLDYRWYDRNRITHLISPIDSIHPESFGMYAFEEVTKNFYISKSNSSKIYRRPIIMANVDNIKNGEYIGINDSASHRYSIQWTGDVPSDLVSLKREIANLLKGENSGITYINSDIGGHTGNPDAHDYVRWMQFGSLSPIIRPHCTVSVSRFREPRNYDERVLNIVREYVKMRYRLLPYIYGLDHRNYISGEPPFRMLSWEFKGDRNTHGLLDEYLIGDKVLVAPVCQNGQEIVESFRYISPVEISYYNGRSFLDEKICDRVYDKIDFSASRSFFDEGIPIDDFCCSISTSLSFDEAVVLYVDNDDGVRVFVDGNLIVDDWKEHGVSRSKIGKFIEGKIYSLKIEYFQGKGDAILKLLYEKEESRDKRDIYLPDGLWMDLFDGKIEVGGRKYRRIFPLYKMGLFVKLGSILPLAYYRGNTKKIAKDEFILDYYPSIEGVDKSFIYEDDGVSTGYKYGEYKETKINYYFEKENSKFVVKISKHDGKYDFSSLEKVFSLKFHSLGKYVVKKMEIDEKEVEFSKTSMDKNVFPLSDSKSSRDSDTYWLNFKKRDDQELIIGIYIIA